MDPDINLLTHPAETDPRALLTDFRTRLRRTSWGHETPNTLLSPVWSTASSVQRFESLLLALFRAHLKVLHFAAADELHGGAGQEYARLERAVRAYYLNWPVLNPDAQLSPELLLSQDASRLLVGRPDIVLGAGGPKVVETNFDTAAAGYERPDDMWTIAAGLFTPPADYMAAGRPLAGLWEYFVELAGATPHHVYWIMKDDAVARKEVGPTIAFLNRETSGVRHSIHYAGDPLPAPSRDRPAYLHRACSIFTVNRDRERFAALLTCLAPVIRGCTVPVGLSHLSSKLFLAWLSDPAARPATLTAEEHDAVETLVPWTRVLALLNDAELKQLRHNRGDYILKKADSHQAMDVHFGCNLTDTEWESLLRKCRVEPHLQHEATNIWIAQERVRPRMYDLLEFTNTGVIERRTGISCCPYLMGGRLRGLETWVTSETPNLDMIKHMHFVPHFIRQGW